ncbi:MAG: SirB1 family protein [Thermoanaerobaculia bacterium]
MTHEPLYIHPAETRRRFEEFARREINEVNLAEGALLIALEECPQMDVEAYLKRLDDMSERVASRIVMGEPDIFLLGHLHSQLFDIEGFTGNLVGYNEVKNSYLNEVIDSKRGIPITLSIIFLHVAQRVGLDAHGVGLPGHYIVRVQFPLSEVYVDPFHEGRTLTVREIDTMLAEMSGGEIRLRPHFLRRWTGRETLIRLLANLQNGHTRAGDKRKALSAEERIAILSRYAPPMPAEPV